MILLPNIPNVPALHHGGQRTKGGVDLLVVHTAETMEMGNSAEGVAAYFAVTTRAASAHYCVDNNSIVRCVQDTLVAYAAPGANANGLHVELAGRASQSAQQWSDVYSLAELDLATRLFAVKAMEHRVPVAWLRAKDLLAGKRGITSHVEVTNAWHLSTHTDPGPAFPASWFVSRISQLVNSEAHQLWILPDQDGMIVQPTGPDTGLHLSPGQVAELLARGWYQVIHRGSVVVTG